MALKYRHATISDAKLLFNWANDHKVREASFYSAPIEWENHIDWFNKKLVDRKTHILIFYNEVASVGLTRIEQNEYSVISISVDAAFRGKGYTKFMLNQACDEYWEHNSTPIHAFIKKDNEASIKAFIKAGFKHLKDEIINGHACSVYIVETRQHPLH